MALFGDVLASSIWDKNAQTFRPLVRPDTESESIFGDLGTVWRFLDRKDKRRFIRVWDFLRLENLRHVADLKEDATHLVLEQWKNVRESLFQSFTLSGGIWHPERELELTHVPVLQNNLFIPFFDGPSLEKGEGSWDAEDLVFKVTGKNYGIDEWKGFYFTDEQTSGWFRIESNTASSFTFEFSDDDNFPISGRYSIPDFRFYAEDIDYDIVSGGLKFKTADPALPNLFAPISFYVNKDAIAESRLLIEESLPDSFTAQQLHILNHLVYRTMTFTNLKDLVSLIAFKPVSFFEDRVLAVSGNVLTTPKYTYGKSGSEAWLHAAGDSLYQGQSLTDGVAIFDKTNSGNLHAALGAIPETILIKVKTLLPGMTEYIPAVLAQVFRVDVPYKVFSL